MYFEVKAFKGAKRRFENLDNMDELNEFVGNWCADNGYNKLIIKSFDCNGFRKRRFIVIKDGVNRFVK